MSYLSKESKQKKCFVIEKLLFVDKYIQKKYEDSFNDPNQYFNLDGIILNKFIHGPKYNDQNRLISYSFVGSPEIFDRRIPLKSLERGSKLNFNPMNSNKDSERGYDQKNMKKSNNTLSLNDDDKLNDMFKNINKRVKTNDVCSYLKYKVNDFYDELPDDILINMKSQEKLLKRYEKYQEDLDKISNKIKSRVKINRNLLIESPKSYIPSFTEPYNNGKENKLSINNLQVYGKNLLKSEFERLKSKIGKKIVYLDDKSNETHNENICLRYESSKEKKLNNFSHIKSFDEDLSLNKSNNKRLIF